MVFKNLCVVVFVRKVASELEGLINNYEKLQMDP